MGALKHSALKIALISMLLWAVDTTSTWARKSASIVICADTGAVYHEADADAITHPASLTKMMTLYLTFKALREKKLTPHQMLRVSEHASAQAPSRLGLKPGTTISVKQVILALVIKSANDAAVVLAEALGKGSEAHFARLMTQQARKLGMTRTIFKNASGLPNMQQITTARDMATLSRALYKNFPQYFKFFKEQKFAYKGQVHENHNHLLGRVQGVDGIKTGFINASGFNLAASVVRNNRRIIAVVMGGKTAGARDQKMIQLLEATYANLRLHRGINKNTEYASITDLIHTLGPTDAQAASFPPPKPRLKTLKASYLSRTGQVKALNSHYASVDDLINIIDETPHACKKSFRRKKIPKVS